MDIAYSCRQKKCDQLAALPADPFEARCYPTKVARDLLDKFGFYSTIKACTAGASINLAVSGATFTPVVLALGRPSFFAPTCKDVAAKIGNDLTQTIGFKRLWSLTGGMLTSLGCFLFFLVDWQPRWFVKLILALLVPTFFLLTITCLLAVYGQIVGSKYRLLTKPVMTLVVAQSVKCFMKSWAVA